jgi:hypothetical protein
MWVVSDAALKKMFKKCAQKVLTLFGHSDKMRPHTENKTQAT